MRANPRHSNGFAVGGKSAANGKPGIGRIPLAAAMSLCMLAFAVETAHARVRLGDAVQSTAQSLSLEIETGTRIAVVAIRAGSDRMSDFLINGMIDAFVSLGMGRYTVVSRDQLELDRIRGELDFQMSWEVDERTAQSIGRMLGVQYIVTGALEPLRNFYHFRVRTIHVETASIRNVSSAVVRRDRSLRDLQGIPGTMDLLLEDRARFWSVGVSAGTAFAEPWMMAGLQGTFAPLRHSFVRVGCDIGFASGIEGVGYFSLHPFLHLAFFLPFETGGGWHIGAGGSFLMAEYRFDGFDVPVRTTMADFTTGLNIGNTIDVSYTLRTDFSVITHRFSTGFTYRFKARSR
ncbi:MAG: penicillin-binding protein activator LpoB [Treponema sp.]|nr:penicillin-binding protein activator LpoB [Treponema sp.]